jgi:WD40 repeat protein
VECGGWRRPYDVVVNKASPHMGLTVVYAPLPPTNENVNTTTNPSSLLSCVQAFSTLLPLPDRFVEEKGSSARQESAAPLSNVLLPPPYKQCSLLSDFHARPTSSVHFCACIPHTVSQHIPETSKQPYNPFSVIFATGGETTQIKLMVSQTLSTIQDSRGQIHGHWPCLPLPHCVNTLSGHESSVRALAVSSPGTMGGGVKDMSEDASLSLSRESPILLVSAGGKQIVRCWRICTHHHHREGPENSGGGSPYCTAEAVSSFKWAEHEVFKKKLTHTKHKKRLWQADKMKEDADQRINDLACFPLLLLQTHGEERANNNVDSVEATEDMDDESRSEDGTKQSLTLKSYHIIVAGTTDGTLLFLLLEENSGHTSLLCCLKPDGARRPILSMKHLCLRIAGGEESSRSMKDVLFAGSTDGTVLIFDISELLRLTRVLLQACPDNDSSLLKDDQLGDIEHWAATTEPLHKLDSNQMGVNSLDIAPVAFPSHGINDNNPPCYVLACGGDDQALCVFWLSFADPTPPTGLFLSLLLACVFRNKTTWR